MAVAVNKTFCPAFVGALEAEPPSDGPAVNIGAEFEIHAVVAPQFVEVVFAGLVTPG